MDNGQKETVQPIEMTPDNVLASAYAIRESVVKDKTSINELQDVYSDFEARYPETFELARDPSRSLEPLRFMASTLNLVNEKKLSLNDATHHIHKSLKRFVYKKESDQVKNNKSCCDVS